MTTLLAAFGALACGGDDSDEPRPRVVKDAAGRSCSLYEDTGRITCNDTPMPSRACTGGASACFTLGTLGSNQAAAVCAGCCQGKSVTSTASDCKLMLCESSATCPTGYRCSGNNCLR